MTSTMEPAQEVAAEASTRTPPRSVRVPDDLWDKVKAKAAARTNRRGDPDPETVTDVIMRALERYVR